MYSQQTLEVIIDVLCLLYCWEFTVGFMVGFSSEYHSFLRTLLRVPENVDQFQNNVVWMWDFFKTCRINIADFLQRRVETMRHLAVPLRPEAHSTLHHFTLGPAGLKRQLGRLKRLPNFQPVQLLQR